MSSWIEDLDHVAELINSREQRILERRHREMYKVSNRAIGRIYTKNRLGLAVRYLQLGVRDIDEIFVA